MSDIKCVECGKFISYKQIDDGIAFKGSDQAWDGEIKDIWYAHKKCWDYEGEL